MNKKLKTVLLIAVFALFIAGATWAYNELGQDAQPQTEIDLALAATETPAPAATELPPAQTDETPQPQEEEKTLAPDFTVLDADGNEVKLSDLIGRPIVLNFWASWCPPCKGEMPEFEEVYQELGQEVTFMMVDLVDGQRETAASGAQYVQEQGFGFPVYFDTTQEAATQYGIVSIPTTIFIDKDGYIVVGAQSAIDAATLRKGIGMIQ